MTSEEINSLQPMDSYATESALLAAIATMVQEIAYQLAVVNEANERADKRMEEERRFNEERWRGHA